MSHYILPDWPVPPQIKAVSTTRLGGESKGAYLSNNLATHVGDNETHVMNNRNRLNQKLKLPSEPLWLNQTHSTVVVDAASRQTNGDACYSHQPGEVCVVMTADCLPILLADKQGRQVAAIHAGWRGLLNGIIEQTVQRFSGDSGDIIAWLGPAIGPGAFEVGADVRDLFIEDNLDNLQAFRQCTSDKWLANIYQLARIRLEALSINSIFGGDFCTFSDESRFYSYRRDKVCGRMASLIWIAHP